MDSSSPAKSSPISNNMPQIEINMSSSPPAIPQKQVRRMGHRRQASIGTAMQPIREGNFFEFFVVVGMQHESNEDTAKKPKILYQFPPEKQIPFDVVPFCMPSDYQNKKISRSGSMSELQSILYGQLSVLEKSANSFLFLVVHEKDVYYGVCVTNKEVYERDLSFATKTKEKPKDTTNNSVPDPNNTNNPNTNNNNNNNNPNTSSSPSDPPTFSRTRSKYPSSFITKRAYCFISRFAFFKLHYGVLYSILARERLYILEESNRWMGDGGLTPSSSDYHEDNDPNEDSATAQSKPPSENDVVQILKSYYTQPVPKAGESLTFKLPGELHSLTFKAPEGSEDRLVGEWCLPATFKTLRLDTILLLINAALLEHRIIVVCQNHGILSSIILSLIPLLRPYAWQGPCIPVVPDNLFECLQAPVPFIVGCLHLPSDIEAELDALLIRIDYPQKEIIKLPSNPIFTVPKRDKLEAALKVCHQTLNRVPPRDFPDPYKSSVDDLDNANKIMQEIHRYHQDILSIVLPNMKPGCLDSASEVEKLVQTINPRKYRDFFAAFFITQQFSEYLDSFFSTQTEEEAAARVMVEQMEEKIKDLEQQRDDALHKISILQMEVKFCDDKVTALRETQQSIRAKSNPFSSLNSPASARPTPKRSFIRASIDMLAKAYNE